MLGICYSAHYCVTVVLKFHISFSNKVCFVVFRDKEHNLNIPLILKHCFKDIKQVDGSDVNVSAICNVCSKVIKGSVTSTTNFLKHLKAPRFFIKMHSFV